MKNKYLKKFFSISTSKGNIDILISIRGVKIIFRQTAIFLMQSTLFALITIQLELEYFLIYFSISRKIYFCFSDTSQY